MIGPVVLDLPQNEGVLIERTSSVDHFFQAAALLSDRNKSWTRLIEVIFNHFIRSESAKLGKLSYIFSTFRCLKTLNTSRHNIRSSLLLSLCLRSSIWLLSRCLSSLSLRGLIRTSCAWLLWFLCDSLSLFRRVPLDWWLLLAVHDLCLLGLRVRISGVSALRTIWLVLGAGNLVLQVCIAALELMVRSPYDSGSLTLLGLLDQALDFVKSDPIIGPNLLELLELGVVNKQVDLQISHLSKLYDFVDECPLPSIFLDGVFPDFLVIFLWRVHFN